MEEPLFDAYFRDGAHSTGPNPTGLDIGSLDRLVPMNEAAVMLVRDLAAPPNRRADLMTVQVLQHLVSACLDLADQVSALGGQVPASVEALRQFPCNVSAGALSACAEELGALNTRISDVQIGHDVKDYFA